MFPRYLFPADYMADPAAKVFDGRVYIYPSHDWDSGASEDDDGGHFQMKDYHVLSLDDIENGEVTDHGVILALEDVPWAAGQLKAEPYPMYGSYSIDPCAFKDEDGEVYIYFGGLWGGQLQRYKDNKILENAYLPEGDVEALPSRVARLTADGLQFAETPKPVVILDENGKPLKANDPHRFFEASWMHKMNGKYYFSYSTGDSHLLCYAIGDNPYGPFTFAGELLQPVVGWTTHHCITEYKGQWYLFHHDCVPSNGITWLRSLKVAPLRIEGEKLYLNV